MKNIYAIIQKIEDYDVIINRQQVGLYSTYRTKPDLFNLITRASVTPFQYEQESTVPPGKRNTEAVGGEALEKSLDQLVGGRTVRELSRELNPEDMLAFFEEHVDDLQDLEIHKYYVQAQSGDTEPWLLLGIMKSRALQWKKHFRGTISVSANKVVASFGAKLTAEEEVDRMKYNIYHARYADES
ncbi:MAG: hypothetical protein SCH71_12650 [Desulfobulbaceae bacterium]|nr:hypothetical protein [Desulfobulbaceae bacterium]